MTDGKKIRNMNKLILFRQFYVMVVAYIYFTRIIVFLLKSTAAYNLTWLSNFAEEGATLAFYCVTSWMFRPIVDPVPAPERGRAGTGGHRGHRGEGVEGRGVVEAGKIEKTREAALRSDARRCIHRRALANASTRHRLRSVPPVTRYEPPDCFLQPARGGYSPRSALRGLFE